MKVILAIVILICAVAHGWNMFNFPYYENDEGVYLSQAWSILHMGQLAPYTYWYDHAPAGWILVAQWLTLFPDLFTFGFGLNHGRVFMWVIHVLSVICVIKIGKKLSGSYFPGCVAAIIFSMSPLGLYFQRRLLLDNIMVFWVLLAYVFILDKTSKLSRIALSGVAMAIGILTKENAIFFIPGFLFTIWQLGHNHHKALLLVKWLVVVTSIVSLYILYATLKGELVPYGTPVIGGSSEHVSLMETLKYQFSRSGGPITDGDSSFWRNLRLWVRQDPVTIYGGVGATLIVLVTAVVKKRYLGLSLLGIFFWWFLARGGIVIEFYVVPLIPLLALYLGLIMFWGCRIILRNKQWFLNTAYGSTLVLVTSLYAYLAPHSAVLAVGTTAGYKIFSSQQTLGQRQAVRWIYENVPEDAMIVIDNYAWLDLHDGKNPSGKVYKNAHWYWKVDEDPEILEGVLKGDPTNIDFIARTPQMNGDLLTGMSPTTSKALENANMVKGFNTDGWGVEIWATTYPRAMLKRAWEYYKRRFISPEGRVRDPYQDGRTTSEGQAYALLRAAWSKDRTTFDQVLNWTLANIQNPEGTLAWLWTGEGNTGGIADRGSASDADVDAALALVLARDIWGNQRYIDEAQKIVTGIWETEVGNYFGKNYLLPGNWAAGKSYPLLNLSYLSPAAFRKFSEIDLDHDWTGLVDTSYEALEACTRSDLGGSISVNLPPNWCALDSPELARKPDDPGTTSTEYSHDAVRVMWRVAMDFIWNSDPRAKKYLDLTSGFLEDKWRNGKNLVLGYTHDGQDWEEYESTVGYAAAMANFMVSNPELADEIYDQKIKPKFYEAYEDNSNMAYWEDPENYYTQNTVWLAVALKTL